MAAYPGALASFVGFTATHTLTQDVHAAQHNLEQAEIVAVQTKVGTGASAPAANQVLTGNGAGTSNWSQVNLTTMVSGVLPVANGGTGTTNTTGTGSVVFSTGPTISGAQLTNSPTLSTPTIADFSNAQHNHQNVAGGGVLSKAAVDSTIAIIISGGNYKIQSGIAIGSAGGDVTVTFPSAFTSTPIILVSFIVTSGGSGFAAIQTTSSSNFTFATLQAFASRIAGNISWLAIGS